MRANVYNVSVNQCGEAQEIAAGSEDIVNPYAPLAHEERIESRTKAPNNADTIE
jgi:hypothetical protein